MGRRPQPEFGEHVVRGILRGEEFTVVGSLDEVEIAVIGVEELDDGLAGRDASEEEAT